MGLAKLDLEPPSLSSPGDYSVSDEDKDSCIRGSTGSELDRGGGGGEDESSEFLNVKHKTFSSKKMQYFWCLKLKHVFFLGCFYNTLSQLNMQSTINKCGFQKIALIQQSAVLRNF